MQRFTEVCKGLQKYAEINTYQSSMYTNLATFQVMHTCSAKTTQQLLSGYFSPDLPELVSIMKKIHKHISRYLGNI